MKRRVAPVEVCPRCDLPVENPPSPQRLTINGHVVEKAFVCLWCYELAQADPNAFEREGWARFPPRGRGAA